MQSDKNMFSPITVTMRRRLVIPVLLAACMPLVSEPALGQNSTQPTTASWNRFRGENGSGQVTNCTVPLPWSDGDVAWKTELPGIGNGSPVVGGDKVFLISGNPENAERYLMAIDLASGKEIWRKTIPSKQHKLHAKSSYASSTPCVGPERVYFCWATPDGLTVACYTHTGETVWTKEFPRYISAHGFGGSPILVDHRLILSNNQDAEELPPGVAPGESHVMALDANTGDTLWKTPRKSVRTSYSTPAVLSEKDGKKTLVFAETGDGLFALDAATGKPLWNSPVFTKRSVSSPVIVGDLVIGTEGSGGGGNALFAVKLTGDHETAFEIKRAAPYVPTPVSNGPLLFLWSDAGIASCVDSRTGEVHWSERIGGNVSTSPVLAGDKLIGIAEDGKVTILEASVSFRKVGELQLGDTTRSTPLVAENYLLLRTNSELICVGKPH